MTNTSSLNLWNTWLNYGLSVEFSQAYLPWPGENKVCG
jgi:hypothetical protein